MHIVCIVSVIVFGIISVGRCESCTTIGEIRTFSAVIQEISSLSLYYAQICLQTEGMTEWRHICSELINGEVWSYDNRYVWCRTMKRRPRAGDTGSVTQVVNTGNTKVSNVNCNRTKDHNILECDYITITEPCRYLHGITCEACSTDLPCNGGICTNTGTCECDETCMNDGICDLGLCQCRYPYYGDSCQYKHCVPPCEEGSCIETTGTCSKTCYNLCGENSECNNQTGLCECEVEYFGDTCQSKNCTSSCSNNETCDYTRGVCQCKVPYYGNSCQYLGRNCVSDCLNGGSCDYRNATCECVGDFKGNSCEIALLFLDGNLHIYIIVAVCLLVVLIVLVGLVVLLCLVFVKIHSRRKKEPKSNPGSMYHVLEPSNVGNSNIDSYYMTMVGGEVIEPSIYEKMTELNQIHPIDNSNTARVSKRKSKIYIEPPRNLSELKEMITAFMYELRAEDIEMGEEFASGQFGVVYRGKYRTSVGDVPVAIKTLKGTVDANKDMKVAFMREAAILAQFHHPNVLRLIGIVTTQQPWMMITELLKTELKQLLLQIRPAMLLLSSSSSSPDKLRIHTLLLSFSQQIAAGMEHLAEKKFIHRDLAARNVLVAKNLSVRVADFGMSREIDSDNDYYSSSGGRVPLRWTSPEALFYKKYSEKSDVWSFGMTLYEIWSLGDKPWEGYKNDEIIEAITNRQTPPQPVSCSHQMYQLMLQTWNREIESRPTFSQLKRQLSLIKVQ